MSKFIVFFFLGLCFITAFSYAEDSPALSPNQLSEIEQIDNEIKMLESKLSDLRKDAFNKEMNAQVYMFDNWDEYAENINANENDEKKIIKIKSKIDQLKSSKLELDHK